MADYHVTANDTRYFRLTEGSRTIGELTYPKWFSFEATLTLAVDPVPFAVSPKGFWGTTIELQQHGQTLLRFKMGWNGNIIIQTTFPGQEPQDFVFQQTGFLKSQYELTNTQHQKLLVLQPDFKWKNLHYEFNIASAETFESLAYKDALLLLALHCANYYISMMSAAVILAAN